MIDALGAAQSILVLGATSEIAAATLTRLAEPGRLNRVVLAARSPERLRAEADRVRSLGVPEVSTELFDADDPGTVTSVVRRAFEAGDIDVVLVAFGVLPDQDRALADTELALASLRVNFLAGAAAALESADALRTQGHGVLVVLSSVAAERPRRSNFLYGSGKAGLDALCVGLAESLRGSGARVLVVRPGFVRTRMTDGMKPAPLATTATAVADAIAAHLTTGSAIVWVPPPLRMVMSALRHLPAPVFRRLPL